jgi:hypothetical protein
MTYQFTLKTSFQTQNAIHDFEQEVENWLIDHSIGHITEPTKTRLRTIDLATYSTIDRYVFEKDFYINNDTDATFFALTWAEHYTGELVADFFQ